MMKFLHSVPVVLVVRSVLLRLRTMSFRSYEGEDVYDNRTVLLIIFKYFICT